MKNLLTANDAENYKIYLVNEGAKSKNFWCFLAEPKGVPNENVYANSDTMLSVVPNYAGENTFTIPLQYKVGAGASNKAVGLNIQIDSAIIRDAKLQSVWEAAYATAPPKQGPHLDRIQGESSPADTLRIKSNDFDQVKNNLETWYSNMTFGIETANGFVGVTWEPSPSDASTITPKFKFYIATGDYSSNELADIATISRDAAEVALADFKNNEATVTLNSNGGWLVTPGKPQ